LPSAAFLGRQRSAEQESEQPASGHSPPPVVQQPHEANSVVKTPRRFPSSDHPRGKRTRCAICPLPTAPSSARDPDPGGRSDRRAPARRVHPSEKRSMHRCLSPTETRKPPRRLPHQGSLANHHHCRSRPPVALALCAQIRYRTESDRSPRGSTREALGPTF